LGYFVDESASVELVLGRKIDAIAPVRLAILANRSD